jgi:hypothetical protein
MAAPSAQSNPTGDDMTNAFTAPSPPRWADDGDLLTASTSPDFFTAPPPGNAISLIKEGFRDEIKHLRS